VGHFTQRVHLGGWICHSMSSATEKKKKKKSHWIYAEFLMDFHLWKAYFYGSM
jgi:hypothetical protein